jgi:PAS domain-containing protein
MSATPTRLAARLLAVAGVLCLLAVVGVVALGWHADLDRQRHGLHALAQGAAPSLTQPSSAPLAAVLRADWVAGALWLDAQGRSLAGVGEAAPAAAESWPLLGDANASARHTWEGRGYAVASAPVPGGGALVLVRPLHPPQLLGLMLGALAAAIAAWGLLALTVMGFARRLPADPRVEALAERLAEAPGERPADPDAYGPQARPVLRLAERLDALQAERDSARALLGASLHVGAQYTVLCTIDGRALDASPSFLARTGLTPEALRAEGALRDLLPMDDLLELAHRSLREGVTLSGIPAELHAPEGPRPLALALRAVDTPEGPAVLLSAADHSRQEELERQVDTFTDAVELMVDQRVSRITAGQRRLEEAIEDAGLAVLEFTRDGVTERLNAVAERLTGRTVFTLRQFGQVAAALCPDGRGREALHAWFWSGDPAPFVLEIEAPGGRRRLAWYAGTWRSGAEVVGRVLVGAAAPEAPGAAGAEGGDPLGHLHDLVTRFDDRSLDPSARPYLEVIREAVRRLETGGDGAAPHPGYAPPAKADRRLSRLEV